IGVAPATGAAAGEDTGAGEDAGAEVHLADAYQQVDVDLQVPLFELQILDLKVSDLSGQISYSSLTGISSKDLQGVFFGEALSLSLASDKAKGANKTLIDLQSKVN